MNIPRRIAIAVLFLAAAVPSRAGQFVKRIKTPEGVVADIVYQYKYVNLMMPSPVSMPMSIGEHRLTSVEVFVVKGGPDVTTLKITDVTLSGRARGSKEYGPTALAGDGAVRLADAIVRQVRLLPAGMPQAADDEGPVRLELEFSGPAGADATGFSSKFVVDDLLNIKSAQ